MKKYLIIPMVTVSESNKREHWHKAAKRHKIQKQTVLFELMAYRIPKSLPVEITMTRLSPRQLDDDNLTAAFKYIRDAIAEYFIPGLAVGRADNDPGFTWKYTQEKSTAKGIGLEFLYPEIP